MGAEDRESILEEAKQYVIKDRNSSYGEPEDNFGNIAAMWNAQGYCFGGVDSVRQITALDVALMMQGMKLARLKTNPLHRDSWADGIGYGACGWDIAKKELEEEELIAGLRAMPDINDELANDLADVANYRITEEPLWAKAGCYGCHKGECKGHAAPDNVNVNDMGWVSENRCDKHDVQGIGAKPHPGHSYGESSSATMPYWCDGYVPADRAQQAADIEAVKRVADKHKLEPFEHHPEEVRPKLKPIKDNSQAEPQSG